MISIVEKDRNYLRFLWFDDVLSSEPKLIQNRYARVVFGVNSSLFLLNRPTFKHEAAEKTFAQLILNAFYVDNISGEEFSEEKSIKLYKKFKLCFIEGHFCQRKWRTKNSRGCDYIQSNFDSSEKNTKQGKILEIS